MTIQFHGGGLAAFHRMPQNISPFRLRLSNTLTRYVMASRSARLQLTAKKLYIKLDTLTPSVLNFFYQDCRVPQNFQSWFSVTQLHIWMVQSRLRNEGKDGKVIAGNLVDHFATDIEMKLWAAGVKNSRTHDRYLHELLSFHYGCVLAYDEGYESGDGVLASSLWRNLFTMSDDIEPDQLNRVVQYVRHQMDYLHKLPLLPAQKPVDESIELNLPLIKSAFSTLSSTK